MLSRPLTLTSIAALAGVLAWLALGDWDDGHEAYAKRGHDRADTYVTVTPTAVGRPIPSGFVGLSFEYPALTRYTGTDPEAVNPVLEQLIRNLAPGQSPVLRIGGDSTDTTWWPTGGVRRPGGISYTLTPQWMAVTKALAQDLGARLIVGLDLEAGVPALAAAEARAFLAQVGRPALRAFEIGNEATRYSHFPWYRRNGRGVLARPASYDFAAFNREFAAVARRLPYGVPLAGPTLGGPGWMSSLGPFLAREPRLGLVTFHRYPFNRCFTPLDSPVYPTVPRLLSAFATHGLDSLLRQYIAVAHGRGLPFRIDEINSVACGGKRGVSDTFASALWALDSLFALARLGVAGVNFHLFPNAKYVPFTFEQRDGQWLATVRPEYYGLMMFAQAAPPGARLLPATVQGEPAVRAWATRGQGGTLRVVLINDDLRRRHVFLVSVPGRLSDATVLRLTAPGARARTGVTLGGQSFGETGTGRFSRPMETELVGPEAGGYRVTLARSSAATLTIPAG